MSIGFRLIYSTVKAIRTFAKFHITSKSGYFHVLNHSVQIDVWESYSVNSNAHTICQGRYLTTACRMSLEYDRGKAFIIKLNVRL